MEKIDLVIEMLKSHQLEVQKQFLQIEKRFDRIDVRLDRIEDEVRSDKEKLQAVYESREKVKIEFGWQWSLVSLFLVVMGVGMSRVLPF